MKKLFKNEYFLTSIIVIFIFLGIFIVKGIFPFGNYSLIYGDMHDQITAFYYQFYDAIKGNASLLINFTTSGGINFFGIMSYYILSPFTLIFLLFSRENIYLVVSIIIALKILASSLTMVYALKYIFKEKINYLLAVTLALAYAFSGYTFFMYQITPWMDAMYMFPLVVVGLIKLFKGEKPYMFIISLTISLICSFYVSTISLIFIFLISLFYIYTYVDKNDRKKRIFSLGISVLLSVLMSLFIIYPSFLQISASSRLALTMKSIFNSKFGPLSDKISYFLLSPFLVIGTFLLFFNFKKDKNILKFFIPSFLILAIPYLIEPINKILHFGSYAYFPNRYGYILFFLMTIITAYYFANVKRKNLDIKGKSIIAIIFTVVISIIGILLTYMNYDKIQNGIYKLSVSKVSGLIFVLIIISLVFMIGLFAVIYLKKNEETLTYPLIFIIVISSIVSFSSATMGISKYLLYLDSQYEVMNKINETYKNGDYYRAKRDTVGLTTNTGMVTKYSNLDHFTSLVDDTNLKVLKTFGYTSYWTKTFSNKGTMFMDIVLGNKYLITKNNMNDDYTLLTSEAGFKFYEYNKDISYGYFTTNAKVLDRENDFSIENDIYKSITGDGENLFTIYDNFDLSNIEVTENNGYSDYKIIDNNIYNYMSINIEVKQRSILYLDVFNSLDNNLDYDMFDSLAIYVNDKLLENKYPTRSENGYLNLGEYEDATVNIKIVLNNNVTLKNLEIGSLDYNKVINMIDKYKVDSEIKFNKNQINIRVNNDTNERELYFIPVNYIDGYSVTVNGKEQEIIKVFDNYLGVYLDSGINEITYTYIPKGLVPASVISLISLVGTILLFRLKLYDKLLNNKILLNCIFYLYLFLYIVFISAIYIVPFGYFILSFI